MRRRRRKGGSNGRGSSRAGRPRSGARNFARRTPRRRQAHRPCRRTSRCCWRAGAPTFSRSAPIAPTMAAHLPTGSSSTTRCAVLGITRASTFGPAKPCTRRPSARSIHGLWSSATAKFSCARSALRRGAKPRQAGRAGQNRDRRRRGRRVRRRGDAPAAAIPGQNRHAEQRRRPAGRPAESFQGLSRRQRAGGLGPPSRRQASIPTTPSTFASGATVAGIDVGSREVALAGGDKIPLRSTSSGDRRRTGAPIHSRRKAVRRPCAALAFGQPRDHRTRQDGAAGGRARRQLHRARSRGFLARPGHRSPCRGARRASDGAHSGCPNWAVYSMLCMRSMASSSISEHGERALKVER